MKSFDEQMMERCLKLALKGRPAAFPNPLVGCVIVKNKKIIAEGYHHQFGGDHAEINAIKNGGSKKYSGATLYCNLEPCAHEGKTPPCVNAVIDAKCKRVVIGMMDPNPLVAGKSIKKMKKAGIEVQVGVCEEKCQKLNRFFLRNIASKRPYVHVKIAASLDGKIALNNGKSKWITDSVARNRARIHRGHFQGILVGANTVLADNPFLGIDPNKKKAHRNDPVRIILDPHAKTPLTSRVYRDNHYIVCVKKGVSIADHHGSVLECAEYSIKKILKKLYAAGIGSLFVEGGAYTISSLLSEKLVDSIEYYLAPKLIGSGKNAFECSEITSLSGAIELEKTHIKKVGGSYVIEGQLLAF